MHSHFVCFIYFKIISPALRRHSRPIRIRGKFGADRNKICPIPLLKTGFSPSQMLSAVVWKVTITLFSFLLPHNFYPSSSLELRTSLYQHGKPSFPINFLLHSFWLVSIRTFTFPDNFNGPDTSITRSDTISLRICFVHVGFSTVLRTFWIPTSPPSTLT